MTSAVWFDFFGTLVSYRPDHIGDGAGGWLAQHGYDAAATRFADDWAGAFATLDDRTAESMREFSMDDVMSAYCQLADLELADADRAALSERFMADWRAPIAPSPDITDLLERLRSAGYRLGIVSNTHLAGLVPSIIDEFGFGHFEPIVLSVDHGYRKPHPSIYDVALARLGTPPGEVLFVGDNREHDVDGPRARGLDALHVTSDNVAAAVIERLTP